jgi:hypothetical protein
MRHNALFSVNCHVRQTPAPHYALPEAPQNLRPHDRMIW